MRNFPPAMQDERFRIEMTVSCRDCDEIPKVSSAGQIAETGDGQIQVMHNGLKVVAGGYYGDWMIEVIERLQGHHEPQEELIFHNLMPFFTENSKMIELGAFWSFYSIWFMLGNPQRSALGIEPDPAHIEIGLKNAALNGVDLELRQGFVAADGPEKASFQTEQSGVIEISRISASNLCRDFAPEGLDLLHVDTQGAETGVIRDCEDLLRSGSIRFLLVSTHGEAISGSPLTHQACLELIGDFGGRILEEHDVHESFSGDGMIAAYFGDQPIDWPDLNLSYNRYSTSLFRNPVFDLAEARNKINSQQRELEVAVAALPDRSSWLKSLFRR